MTPEEFEKYVSNIYKSEGYEVQLTPLSNDWGLDIIALKGNEKIGIQVKMYGNSSRKINRTMIMELHGAATFQDCTNIVMATDGEVMPDAVTVAKKLGVAIRYIKPIEDRLNNDANRNQNLKFMNTVTVKREGYPSLGTVWEKYIIPLQGKEIQEGSLKNKILNVDFGGVTRVSSKGNKNKILYEGFEIAYNLLLEEGYVTRDAINQAYPKRGSSGIVLILSQVPFIECTTDPKGLKLLPLKETI